eukprot:6203858-Pleurochrysis_carterae.AAC.2
MCSPSVRAASRCKTGACVSACLGVRPWCLPRPRDLCRSEPHATWQSALDAGAAARARSAPEAA